jgi:hypothetical protein
MSVSDCNPHSTNVGQIRPPNSLRYQLVVWYWPISGNSENSESRPWLETAFAWRGCCILGSHQEFQIGSLWWKFQVGAHRSKRAESDTVWETSTRALLDAGPVYGRDRPARLTVLIRQQCSILAQTSELNTRLVHDNRVLQVCYKPNDAYCSQCIWGAILKSKTKFSNSESTKIRHFEIKNLNQKSFFEGAMPRSS